jgi:hypothetical protein
MKLTPFVPVTPEEAKLNAAKARYEKTRAKLTSNIEHELTLPPEEQIATLRKTIAHLEQKLYQVSKKQAGDAVKLNEIHEPSLKKTIKGVSNRLKELDGLVHHLINKETVLTEVSLYVRKKNDWALVSQFHIAVMMAYDKDQAWWGKVGNLMTIGEWYTKIMGLLENQNEK